MERITRDLDNYEYYSNTFQSSEAHTFALHKCQVPIWENSQFLKIASDRHFIMILSFWSFKTKEKVWANPRSLELSAISFLYVLLRISMRGPTVKRWWEWWSISCYTKAFPMPLRENEVTPVIQIRCSQAKAFCHSKRRSACGLSEIIWALSILFIIYLFYFKTHRLLHQRGLVHVF